MKAERPEHHGISVFLIGTQDGVIFAELLGLAGLAELIARLYVTHPGVTAEGIMEKMGLLGKL